MKKIFPLIVLCAVSLLLAACGSVPLTGRKQILLVSENEVLSASLAQYQEFMKKAPLSTDKAKTAMVERVGRKIATATDTYLKQNGMSAAAASFKWEFKLVKNNQVNAFCMPGGKIVVYEGLLQLAKSDDELAVVVGHEVAHAVAKHSNERMSQQLLTQYGAVILNDALSSKSDAIRQIGGAVFGLGAQLGFMLPFSRKHELEADHMGLIFMTMAGYDPKVAPGFWEKMAANGGSTLEVLSTHPSDERRIQQMQRLLPEMDKYRPRR